MGFLDKLGQKLKEEATRLAKPPSASGIGAEKLLEHFEMHPLTRPLVLYKPELFSMLYARDLKLRRLS